MTSAAELHHDQPVDACQRMLPTARALIDAVHGRDPHRVRAALEHARRIGVLAGTHPADTLAVVLADLAPTPAEAATITVLRAADGPADATRLLETLGLAGHGDNDPPPPDPPTDTRPATPERHGDYAGYQRHRKAGEDPCQPCQDASNAYGQNYRARRAAAVRATRPTRRLA